MLEGEESSMEEDHDPSQPQEYLHLAAASVADCVDEDAATGTKWRSGCDRIKLGSQDVRMVGSKVRRVDT